MKYFIFFFCVWQIYGLYDNDFDIDCKGKTFENVTMTAYYPDYSGDSESGFLDKKGRKLRTLQDYLDDRTGYVTLAMDDDLGLPYGSDVCIPEINKHYGHRVRFQIRDSSLDLKGSGYERVDICVRSEMDSYDVSVNRKVTVVFVQNK
ncbi:unnamed protein product [Brassicogethes aeneus]|uniref:Uncharacterized protein n=1 Tax=Brassicogethes aeneus TaxID=1431903 RepID=A0A9P0BGI6_BRAAE|nr:unnamed protein product [Brassicogethes aeneus]